MTTVTALTSRRALAPTVRQGRLSRAGASDSARSSTIRIRRCRAARAAFRLPGAAIIARASDDVHARGLDAASDGDVPPRTNDAVRDDPVRKLAVALAATAAMAHCDVALAADAAAEVAAASGFWGLAPVVWLKSGWTGFTGLLASPEAKDIYVYTIKTLISWGVPAVTVGIVAFFVIGSSRKNKGGADKPGGGFSLFGGGRAGEKPGPFVIKRLNDRLDSYAYAFDQAVIGKEAVDAARRRTAFADKYAAVLGKLTAKEREAVTAAKEQWAREDARLRVEMASLSRKIRADAVRSADGKKKTSNGATATTPARLPIYPPRTSRCRSTISRCSTRSRTRRSGRCTPRRSPRRKRTGLPAKSLEKSPGKKPTATRGRTPSSRNSPSWAAASAVSSPSSPPSDRTPRPSTSPPSREHSRRTSARG